MRKFVKSNTSQTHRTFLTKSSFSCRPPCNCVQAVADGQPQSFRRRGRIRRRCAIRREGAPPPLRFSRALLIFGADPQEHEALRAQQRRPPFHPRRRALHPRRNRDAHPLQPPQRAELACRCEPALCCRLFSRLMLRGRLRQVGAQLVLDRLFGQHGEDEDWGPRQDFCAAFVCIFFNAIPLQVTARTLALPLWTGATAAQTLPWPAHNLLTWLQVLQA